MRGVVREKNSAMMKMLEKAMSYRLMIPLIMPAPKPVIISFPVRPVLILKMPVRRITDIISNAFVMPISPKPALSLIMVSARPVTANMPPANATTLKPVRKTAIQRAVLAGLCKFRRTNAHTTALITNVVFASPVW